MNATLRMIESIRTQISDRQACLESPRLAPEVRADLEREIDVKRGVLAKLEAEARAMAS